MVIGSVKRFPARRRGVRAAAAALGALTNTVRRLTPRSFVLSNPRGFAREAEGAWITLLRHALEYIGQAREIGDAQGLAAQGRGDAGGGEQRLGAGQQRPQALAQHLAA